MRCIGYLKWLGSYLIPRFLNQTYKCCGIRSIRKSTQSFRKHYANVMAENTYTGCHKYVPFHSAYEPAAYYFRDDFFLQQMTTAMLFYFDA
jgi:hypothetical protein